MTETAQVAHFKRTAGEDVEFYRLLKSDGTKTAGSTEVPEGVTVFEAQNGQDVGVRYAGPARCKLTGSVSKGDELMPAADGKVQAAGGSGNTIVGRAMMDADAGTEVYFWLYARTYTN